MTRETHGHTPRQGYPDSQDRHLRPSILVVDDDPDMRGYLRRCLASVSLHVVEARDGAQALERVREAGPGAFDLIIADVVMPKLGGLSLRAALAADPALGTPMVLLISGEHPGPDVEPLLRKPFNARTLRQRVDDLLSRGAHGVPEE